MTESKLKKLSRDPLHERTYSELRDAIMSAAFAPGDRLTVRGIAAQFGISAMPVRAAFARLIAEKAVVQNANGTIEIPHMTREHYRELIMLRALLEGRAAEIAASRITPEELEALRLLGDRLTEASKAADAKAYITLNQKFKFAVVAAAKSPVLAELVEQLWMRVGPFMRFYAADVHIQHELDKHVEAVGAMARGDAAAARLAIERDILDGAEFLFSSGVMR
jgi:DNA-binding GntR family transcriptional regulator